VLFIYWTADMYVKTGCYNLDCAAFVQTNHNWFLGGTWDHYSTASSRWGFEMQWKLYKGNWRLILRGPGSYEAVGYYPTSIYKDGQMSKNSTKIRYGGEVNRRIGNSWPQMGSGTLSTQGLSVAADQHTIFYIPRDENGGVGVWIHLDPTADSCYSVNITNFPNDGDWGTYIAYGGPGGDVCGQKIFCSGVPQLLLLFRTFRSDTPELKPLIPFVHPISRALDTRNCFIQRQYVLFQV
jgi:hypothetical protein